MSESETRAAERMTQREQGYKMDRCMYRMYIVHSNVCIRARPSLPCIPLDSRSLSEVIQEVESGKGLLCVGLPCLVHAYSKVASITR